MSLATVFIGEGGSACNHGLVPQPLRVTPAAESESHFNTFISPLICTFQNGKDFALLFMAVFQDPEQCLVYSMQSVNIY